MSRREAHQDRNEPSSRRPLTRVLAIHEEIAKRDYPNAKALSQKLGVSHKTILRDVRFMRDDLGMPLKYDERRHGFFYTRPVQEFPLLETTAEDLVGLILARSALDSVRGSALEESIRAGFQKIQQSMSHRVSIPWNEVDQAFSVKMQGMTETDIFAFERIARAVMESRELRFSYQKPSDAEPMTRVVQPYHLTEIDRGWYVIGFDHARQARRTFAVQRMTSVELLDTRFRRPEDFKLEEHFAGSFGVWAGDDISSAQQFSIRVRFRGFAARVVAERRWHPSQEIKRVKEDGSVVDLYLQLTALEDVSRWILGYGALAEVLDPPELRESIAEELSAASRQYAK